MQEPTYSKVLPWKYFNYALLHSRGLMHVFDTMRYDKAFFARRSDVEAIQQIIGDDSAHVLRPFTILLGCFDERGKTRPGWTHERLLSDQELKEIDSLAELYELNADHTAFKPTAAVNYESRLEITALLRQVLDIMYANKAFPDTEGDAHRIEQAFYSPTEELKVSLRTFTIGKMKWVLP